jgi:hypothetical protein
VSAQKRKGRKPLGSGPENLLECQVYGPEILASKTTNWISTQQVIMRFVYHESRSTVNVGRSATVTRRVAMATPRRSPQPRECSLDTRSILRGSRRRARDRDDGATVARLRRDAAHDFASIRAPIFAGDDVLSGLLLAAARRLRRLLERARRRQRRQRLAFAR